MTDFAALVKFGHSPAKAMEILLDAKRNDAFSKLWIDAVKTALLVSNKELTPCNP